MKYCSKIIRYKYYILLCMGLILFNSSPLLAQNSTKQDTSRFSIHTSFSEFHELEAAALADSRIEKLEKIIKLHLRKAKLENDPIEIARAFYYIILISQFNNEMGL